MFASARSRARWALATAVYVGIAAWCTWPMLRSPTALLGTSASPSEDLLLSLWILRWDVHALSTAPATLFDANIFHPARYSLAASEHLLGIVPLFAPIWWATGSAVVALNASAFATFVLSGLFMHALVRAWTRRELPAYVAGVAFACAPWRLTSLPVIPHALASEYLPLVLLALDRTLRTGSRRSAVLLAGALTLQALSSYYVAYMAFVVVAVWCVLALAIVGVRGRRRQWTALGAAVVASAGVVAALSWPYLATKAGGGLRTNVTTAASLIALFAVGGRPLHVLLTHVGYAPTLLAAPGLVLAFVTTRTRIVALRLASVVGITAVALVLAQGPGDPTGLYALAARTVPGFENIRIPARFGALAAFGVCTLAGLSLAMALQTIRERPLMADTTRAVAIGLLVGGLAGNASRAPAMYASSLPGVDAIPAAYRWLAEHGDGGPLLEAPEPATIAAVPERAMRMYWSTFHWLPMVSGYSGYTPPSFDFLLPYLAQLPSAQAFDLVARCTGIRWVLVHGGDPRRKYWDTIPGIRAVGILPQEGGDTLYEVVAPRADACAAMLATGAGDEALAAVGPAAIAVATTRASVSGLPPVVVAGAETLVTVTLENRGPGLRGVSGVLGARGPTVVATWTPHATPRAFVESALPIPIDVRPGEVARFDAWLRHPRAPGSYDVRVFVRAGAAPLNEAAPSWRARVRVELAPVSAPGAVPVRIHSDDAGA